MVQEIWKDIEGYEGRYQVSSIGRVRALFAYRGVLGPRLLKPRLTKEGYYSVKIGKSLLVHRLVAKAFISGFSKGLIVNHIDENKLNNNVENLEWIDSRHNTYHGTAIARLTKIVQERYGTQVERVDNTGNVTASYASIRAAMRSTGLSKSIIKTNCKYHFDGWRYKGENLIEPPKRELQPFDITEEWRDVKGYEGLYQVSSFGRVRTLPMNTLVELRLWGNDPYLRAKPIGRVHRLVAEAFLQKNNPLDNTVNHINENPQDNRTINLEWCSHAYNINYGKTRLRIRQTKANKGVNEKVLCQRRSSKVAERPVLCISEDGEILAEYKSIMEASRLTGISDKRISDCCNGRQNFAGNYHWAFKKDYSF